MGAAFLHLISFSTQFDTFQNTVWSDSKAACVAILYRQYQQAISKFIKKKLLVAIFTFFSFTLFAQKSTMPVLLKPWAW